MFINLLTDLPKVKTIIIAPHPDDEWIGCGCTIQKKVDTAEKILILIITRMPYSERRIQLSRQLAKQYKYDLKILGEPELRIDAQKLKIFLNKHIEKTDSVYIPSYDLHPDHRKIAAISRRLLKNNLYEYAVYNNSLNPFRRIKNKLLSFLIKQTPASFRKGKPDFILNYHTKIKNRHILEFAETPRAGDMIRKVNYHKS